MGRVIKITSAIAFSLILFVSQMNLLTYATTENNIDEQTQVSEDNQGQSEVTTEADTTVDAESSSEYGKVIAPFSSITNSGVSLNIPGYDEVGWDVGVVKDVNVTVDFGDSTSSDKTLKVTVPDGMRYELIPVKGNENKTGVDTVILSNLGTSDPLYTAITDITLPKKETFAGGATIGQVVYTFTPGTQVVTINLKVSVDKNKYYNPHTIANPIQASALLNKGAIVSVGDVSQTIKASGTPQGGTNHTPIPTANLTPSSQLLKSSSGNITQGTGYGVTHFGLYTLGATNVVPKKVRIEVPYPVGTEFVGISNNNYTLVENNQVTGVAVYESNAEFLNYTQLSYFVNYSLPLELNVGTYTASQVDKVTYTWYDDTTTTVSRSGAISSVEVVDSYPNKVNINPNTTENTFSTGIKDQLDFVANVQVQNKQAGALTNQTYEVNIDSNFKAVKIHFPFDRTVTDNQVTQMYYKTNLNNTWQTYTGDVTAFNNKISSISKTQMGLSDDEFITGFKANIGDLSFGYMSSVTTGGAGSNIVGVLGTLDVGSGQVNIVYSIYDDSDKANTLVSSTRTVKEYKSDNMTFMSNSSASYRDVKNPNTVITNVTAGNVFNIKANLRAFVLYHGYKNGIQAIENPDIYLREPANLKINLSSIKVTDQDGNPVAFIVSQHTNSFGETMYTLKTQNSAIGSYFSEDFKEKYLNITYDVQTLVKASGSYQINELMSWGRQDIKPITNIDGLATTIDKYDFNGNGNTTEPMLAVSTNQINIAENKNVLVETFLALKGEAPKGAYVEGDTSNLAYFTPGTEADYTIKITNNGDVPADAMTTYVPIPKTGQSFGSSFQSDAFKWDMTLETAVTLDPAYAGKFQVQYSTDATEANYKTTATYSPSAPSDLSTVRMVRLVALVPIAPAEEIQVLIPLKVNETFGTAVPGKVGTKDIFNPVYEVDSATFKGILPGTKVGAELVIAEIGGFAFVDNNADGLYDPADGDTLVANHEVELYIWNSVTKKYDPVLDNGTPITTTTDANGVYLFDYTKGMNYGNYAVRFVEKTGGVYQYTINNPLDSTRNSDAIIANDIPNPGDTYRGWVINIDPTKPEAKTIGVGFLAYNPPVDLQVSINPTPNQVKVGNTITVNPNVEPDFFDSIKHASSPYTWEIVGSASEQAKATLTTNANGSVTITPAALASGTTTFALQVTIKDAYGNTKTSDPVTITVISNVGPTITTPTLTKYVGDTYNMLEGVSAKDNTNASMTLITSGATPNTTITSNIPNASSQYSTAGTYEVTYVVKDANENSSTVTRVIKVNGMPVINANAQVYTVSDTNIADSVVASASASWQQAGDGVGATPSAQNLVPTYTIVSGPSTTDFSQAGLYKVEYTATNADNKTTTKTVDVLVKNDSLVTDPSNTLMIDATDFSILNADAATLSEAVAKDSTHGQAKAYKQVDDGNGNISIVEVSTSVSVDADELAAINAAPKEGGTYPLTYSLSVDGKTVSKTVTVSVAISTDPLVINLGNEKTLKVGETLSVTPIITPSYWTSIQDSTEAYSWTLVDAGDAEYVTLEDADQEVVRLVGVKKLVNDTVTLQLTIKDKTGRTFSQTVAVKVVTNVPPTIEVEDILAYVGDTKDLTSGLNVTDDDNNSIAVATGTNGNTIITESIPADDMYTTPGTYAVTYDVKDQYDNLATKTITVKVHGLPTLTVNPVVYTLNDTNILDAVMNQASASWVEAQDGVGTSTQTVSIPGPAKAVKENNSIMYEVVAGVNGKTDFSEAGVYQVQFTAINPDGKEVSKTVDILVMPKNTEVDPSGTLYLSAKGFTIDNQDAKDLSAELAKTNGQVAAYKTEKDKDGTIIDYTELTDRVSVDAEQLSVIQAASTKGGIYDLSYTLVDGANSVTKTVKVVVRGTNTPDPVPTPDGNMLSITASDYTISYEEAVRLGNDDAITYGQVESYLFEQPAVFSLFGFITNNTAITITANQQDLRVINGTSISGGVYDLTYTASYTDADSNVTTISTTVKVTVLGGASVLPSTGTNEIEFVAIGGIAIAVAMGIWMSRRDKEQ
ncbi:hypothetical protein [Culicoidibacter larvae]|uniref:DUF5011 domain-containing protein n=1 Tax=Culicoidibacter larvae TaxID=2579976 RepID=A0A5R8QEW8_9FIRM|nr:hypothetical protein [Culicoidibacter larvae]TLG75492.1 hypothetical protein FEZ08_05460 [Culicoidibacter larvae]